MDDVSLQHHQITPNLGKISITYSDLVHNSDYEIYLIASNENPDFYTAKWLSIQSYKFSTPIDKGK